MKQKFWETAYAVGIFGWLIVFIYAALDVTLPGGIKLSETFLILWTIVPIIWMFYCGFGLNDHFQYELGWRERTPPEGTRKMEDTTPAKRIILQWLAPFALCYFVVRHSRNKQNYATGR